MAMAGGESSSHGGGRGRELTLSVVPQQHKEERNEEFPWATLLSQLQNSVSQVQGHVNQHFQRRTGGWQIGGWGRRERRQSERIALRGGRFAAIIPGDSVAETVISSGIFNFLNIYNTLLVARLILTWFPDPPAIIANPLSTICDPYLNIFRGIIPPLGQIDLSPVLAFLALNVFTNAAAALPAELPSNRATAQSPPASLLTWRQRAQLKKGKSPTICDPYLNIFRGIIPPLGGTLDLSPILAFLALDVFTNTATALPCELPSSTPTTKNPSGNHSNWRQLVQLKKVGLRSTKRDE